MPGAHECLSCGRECFPEDAYCSHCGTRLQARTADTGVARRTIVRETVPTADRLACLSCHSPLLAGEEYCSVCGARRGPTAPDAIPDESRVELLRRLEEATRGEFEFIREVGRGGMGAVYLARELELERNVAIKVLSPGWLTDESWVERFRREARTIASLRHSSIVHVHGVGRAEGVHYFVMDFIDGVSLGRILQAHGRLSIGATLAILGQVGSALNYAHRPGRRVIHRDIKPGNIMVDTEGNSYVTDFGISKAAESHSGLTVTGLIMGTPEYMSPEQCKGETVGPASDQYALGAVAFAMLTGSPPFSGPYYRVLVGHTTSEAPPQVRDLRPDCPPDVADTVMRMLAKQPDDRWPDVAHAMKAMGARPLLAEDPVREELAALVTVLQTTRRDFAATPEVVAARVELPSGTPTWLRILPVPQSLEAGDSVALRARKGFADGREVENGDIAWQSTDPAIARIDPDTGQLVALRAGTAVITASVADVQESIEVNVKPAPVAQLVLDPATLELEVGATAVVGAQPRSRRGGALERPVLWSSSEPGVATVTESGEIRAHREGTASILAHCEGVGAAASVTVVPAVVVAVRLAGAPESVRVGQTVRLIADARDVRGDRLVRAVLFTTSDATVARVSADGLVTALAEGRVVITATCEAASATADIAVVPIPVDRIALSSAPTELVAGDTFHLTASPQDAEGRALHRVVEWQVDDERVLEALGGGRFRAAGAGPVVVSARADDVESRVALTVDPVRVVSIVVSSSATTVDQDASIQLSAELRDQRGRTVQRAVQWSTSDAFIARINARGVLLGTGQGTVTVTAECEGARDAVLVTVNAAPWATVVMRPDATTGPQTKPVEQREASDAPAVPGRAQPELPTTARPAGPAPTSPLAQPTATPASPLARPPSREVATAAARAPAIDAPAAKPPATKPPATKPPASKPPATKSPPAAPVVAERVPAVPAAGAEHDWRNRLKWIAPLAIVLGAGGIWALLSGGDDDAGSAPPLDGAGVVAELSILDATTRSPAAAELNLVLGDTLRLVAQAARADGSAIADAIIDWSTTDASLATVDGAGTVIAHAAGAVRIGASVGAMRRDIALTIATRETTADAVTEPPATRTGAAPPQQTPRQQAPPQRPTQPPAGQRAAVTDSTPPAQPLPDGFLQLIVVPWADVYVDGELKARQQGRPPAIRLRPGTHELRLENPDFATVNRRIEIRPGANTQLRIEMPPRGS